MIMGLKRETIVSVARFIEAHADERLTLAVLAERAGSSPTRLQKEFKALLGVTPKQYQDAMRLSEFKASLASGGSVTGAIVEAGFGSSSRVYGVSSRNIGMTPSAYRSGGEGEQIFFACRETSFGPLMMAATLRGVCFAHFGENETELLERLQTEFPKAEFSPSAAQESVALDDWIDRLDDHLSRSAPRPDLPLDVRGTVFQILVWRTLLTLPEGDTVSYAELADAAGKPKAVRAAASACARNRIAVLIPCHRVLRSDGDLGAYRWGAERKRVLLALEKERAAEE